jgi:nicotinate-nucleotide adenylyltransferase
VSAAARLGILGGSFDPPHRGHLHAARAAREAFDLDEVRFVPAARPPHKPGRVLASGVHRVAMLELLLQDEPGCDVDPRELDRAGPSFTVDTFCELAAEGAADLFLILGTDNLPGLPDWRRVEELLGIAQPVVIHRAGAGVDPLAGLAARLSPEALERLRIGLVATEPYEASSTELRTFVERRAGATLPGELAAYIREHGLYDTGGATH